MKASAAPITSTTEHLDLGITSGCTADDGCRTGAEALSASDSMRRRAGGLLPASDSTRRRTRLGLPRACGVSSSGAAPSQPPEDGFSQRRWPAAKVTTTVWRRGQWRSIASAARSAWGACGGG